MSEFTPWLAARRPRPPGDLAARLEAVEATGPSLMRGLVSAGVLLLDEARSRPGPERRSAFRLLEADALLTYACEAALESEDPATELRSVLVALGT